MEDGHKEGKKDKNEHNKQTNKQKLCTWNPLCERNSNSPAEWSRHRVSTHHRRHAHGMVPNGKEKKHRPGQTDKNDQGRRITLSANLWASPVPLYTLYTVNGIWK